MRLATFSLLLFIFLGISSITLALGVAPTPVDAQPPETGSITGRVKNRWVKRFPAVVFIDAIKGRTFRAPEEPLQVDQVGKEFKPRVVPVVAGTKVHFLNSDPFEHNVLSPEEEFNLGRWGQGEKRG